MTEKARPASWANWRKFAETGEPNAGSESYLYSDSAVIGTDSDFGPFRLMNTFAGDVKEMSLARPVIGLRIRNAINPSPNKLDAHYGAKQRDEIAALSSLLLGIRLQSGGDTRWFPWLEDPLGTPRAEAEVERPFLLPGAWTPIIPSLQRDMDNAASLDGLELLGSYPLLDEDTATALVRAARLYQEAIWVAERDAWLTWLLLVSAVETAADEFALDESIPAAELFQSLAPDLFKACQRHGDECVADVAKVQLPKLGATRKFLSFLLSFMPGPPLKRAPEYQQEWTQDALRKSLRIVYDMRSKHLHGGKAIPTLVCMAPGPRHGLPRERVQHVQAESKAQPFAKLIDESLPMYLHVFEHIVRNAILAWWSMCAHDAGWQPVSVEAGQR